MVRRGRTTGEMNGLVGVLAHHHKIKKETGRQGAWVPRKRPKKRGETRDLGGFLTPMDPEA